MKKAEVFPESEEGKLLDMGLLGDITPQTLLDIMVYMNGLYFALRSGVEHRQLRFDPPQIKLVENERPYLVYTEDLSKNNPGGIKGRKIKQKVVVHHENEKKSWCFVRLFKLSQCVPQG